MNIYLSILIGVLVLMSCASQSQPAQLSDNSVKNTLPQAPLVPVSSKNQKDDKRIDEVIETFSDESKIAVPRKNKIEISESKAAETYSVELKFYSIGKAKNWELKQTIKMESGSPRLAAQVKDFNNDGFKDVTYVSDLAARGANEIRRLFIYDPKTRQLIYIKNSEDYPNIFYNRALKCIGAQRFYGGNATDFAKIEGDTLKTFASVETLGTERKVYLIDKNNNQKLLRTDVVSEDKQFELYKTFDPPKAYTAKELNP